jgi:hypothetical protein
MAADILAAPGGGKPVVPLPDLADGYENQRALDAANVSARERFTVKPTEVR